MGKLVLLKADEIIWVSWRKGIYRIVISVHSVPSEHLLKLVTSVSCSKFIITTDDRVIRKVFCRLKLPQWIYDRESNIAQDFISFCFVFDAVWTFTRIDSKLDKFLENWLFTASECDGLTFVQANWGSFSWVSERFSNRRPKSFKIFRFTCGRLQLFLNILETLFWKKPIEASLHLKKWDFSYSIEVWFCLSRSFNALCEDESHRIIILIRIITHNKARVIICWKIVVISLVGDVLAKSLVKILPFLQDVRNDQRIANDREQSSQSWRLCLRVSWGSEGNTLSE